jgi:RNA polymerase sigma-70 factor (ECF subfamily)
LSHAEANAMTLPPEPDPYTTRATLLLQLRPDSPVREAAWRDFYEMYAPIIGGFARKMGVRGDDIRDVVQEVMLGFFDISPEFVYDPSRGRFRGYLKTCTWRKIKKRFGSRLRVDDRPVEQIADDEPQVDQAWNDTWEEQDLRRAVEQVRRQYSARADTARTFRAFEMYALLEQPPESIAQQLDISVDSVYQAKARVSKAIKAAMDQFDETIG